MTTWRTKTISSSNRRKIKKSGSGSKQPGAIYRWLASALALLALFYLISYLVPRVEITIIPVSRLVTFQESLAIVPADDLDEDISPDQKSLPGKKISLAGTVSEIFQTSGEKDIGEKASGQATFYNYTGLSQEVLIEDGLEAINGEVFTVKAPLLIPPASVSPDGEIIPGEIEADIVALEPGEQNNIQPQKIFISSVPPDKQLKIYGIIQQALTGGASEIIRIISEEDIATAQENLRNNLSEKLVEQLREELPAGQSFIGESFSLINERFTSQLNVEEETEEFNYELSAQSEVIIYTEEKLIEYIKNSLASQLGPAETFLSDKPRSMEILETRQDPNGSQIVKFSADWAVSQPLQPGSIKEKIQGQREADARRIILQQPGVADARFDWWLAINKRVPKIPSHIELVLQAI